MIKNQTREFSAGQRHGTTPCSTSILLHVISRKRHERKGVKKMKKLLSLVLVFVLAFSVPAQAAVKKITAAACEGEDQTDYPTITTGKTKVTLKCKSWNAPGCLIFTAPKAGTYKFSVKNYTAGSTWVSASAGSPLNEVIFGIGRTRQWNGPYSAKMKFEKGDSIYISLFQSDLETDKYENGKLTLAIKKVK